MSLVGHAFVMFSIGCVFGVTGAWDRRALLALWFLTVALYLVTVAVTGTTTSGPFDWARFLVGVVAFLVGMFSGEFMYDHAVGDTGVTA